MTTYLLVGKFVFCLFIRLWANERRLGPSQILHQSYPVDHPSSVCGPFALLPPRPGKKKKNSCQIVPLFGLKCSDSVTSALSRCVWPACSITLEWWRTVCSSVWILFCCQPTTSRHQGTWSTWSWWRARSPCTAGGPCVWHPGIIGISSCVFRIIFF